MNNKRASWTIGAFASALVAAETENQKLKNQLERIKFTLDGFLSEVEAAQAHLRSKGGQQVSFHGHFVNTDPQTLRKLRWWAQVLLESFKVG